MGPLPVRDLRTLPATDSHCFGDLALRILKTKKALSSWIRAFSFALSNSGSGRVFLPLFEKTAASSPIRTPSSKPAFGLGGIALALRSQRDVLMIMQGRQPILRPYLSPLPANIRP